MSVQIIILNIKKIMEINSKIMSIYNLNEHISIFVNPLLAVDKIID